MPQPPLIEVGAYSRLGNDDSNPVGCRRKPPVAVSGGNCDAEYGGKHGDSESVLGARGFGAEIVRRVEEPEPRLWPDPSTLRGLFHPNARTVCDLGCTMISAILNLR